MKKIKHISLLVLLFLCISVLSACSGNSKSEKEIANDIAEQNHYFQTYDLELEDYTVSKRQTNKEEKTDYVWITISGSNDDFEYTAEYELLYVLYNDGWLLEDYELVDSSYKALSVYETNEIEAELSQEYDVLSLVDRNDGTNKVTLTYAAEKHDELFTTHYEVVVEAEFEPSVWEVTDIEVTEGDRELNVIGEWVYTDTDGRYYYMHISNVQDTTVTINYLFANTSKTDEWNYISSDGYQDIELKTYYSKYTGAHDDLLYFHLTNGSGSPAGMGGDVNFGYLWLEETLFTDGTTYCGFTINQKYLTRKNSSATPVIGMDEIEMDTSTNIAPENMTDEQRIIYLLNDGDIDGALAYIEKLSDKSQEVNSLESEINEFNEMYGAYLGNWVEDTSSTPEELVISCRYEDELILCLVLGETIEGNRKLFDLSNTDADYDVLVFHSNTIDPDKYHYIDYNSYWETLSYHWETDDGLSTLGSDYIKQ